MASNPIHVELRGENAEFLQECVEFGEAASADAMLNALVQQERERRQTALEGRLLAALASGRIEMTYEELCSDRAWDILTTRQSVPAASLDFDAG